MLQRKNLGEPDEVVRVGRGRIEMVKLGGLRVGRAILEPGWRWSEDARPIAGTPSCQAGHAAVVLSGRMHVRMDDGAELDLAPGDAHIVSPGHDAWVVGNEPLLILDILALDQAGSSNGGQTIACPCGVSFSVASKDAQEHLLGAVRDHAEKSHGHTPSRDELLAAMKGDPALTPVA